MALSSVAPSPVFLRCSLKFGLWDGLTAPTQYSQAINFSEVKLAVPKQEEIELLSNMIESYGAALDSQQKPTESGTVGLKFNTFTPELLAIVTGADYSAASQTGSTVTNEAVTGVLNLWVPLANKHLSSTGIAVTKSSVAVDAAKYQVDLVEGMFMALHADAVGALEIDYTVVARSWGQYDAGKANTNYVRIRGQAQDRYTGKTGILDIYKASLAPDGEFDPVTGEYLEGSLTGKLIQPVGFDSPWSWQAVTA